MRIKQDARFRVDRERYRLRFCCEDCAMYAADKKTCSLEFPVEEHLVAHYDDPTVEIVFCKDWQLL